MARAKLVKARKDYPQFGIVAGQMHYHWSMKTGPRSSREYRQAKQPSRSQLTSSEFRGTLYDIFDDQIANADGPDMLREAAEAVRELGQEQQEKFDNMPDGLQQGPTGQMLEERASGCDSAADEIETAADDLENKLSEIADEEEEHNTNLAKWEAYRAAEADWDEDGDEPEPEEPDCEEPDESRSFDDERAEALTDAISSAQDAEGTADCA